MTRRVAGICLLCGVIGLLGGCSSGPSDDGGGGIDPIPQPLVGPSLAGMEPGVAEQIRVARGELASALEGAEPEKTQALAFGQLAMLYQVFDLAAAAETAYAQAERLDPDDVRWPYYRSIALKTVSRWDEADRSLSRALELRPGYVPALLRRGDLALAAGSPDRAQQHFQRALRLAPDSAAVRVGLGRSAAERGDHEEAIRWFEEALALAPEASEIHYPLGLSYRMQGRTDRAAALLANRGDTRAPTEDPLLDELSTLGSGRWLHQTRGQLLLQQGRFEEALAAFREADAAQPGSGALHVLLGLTLVRLGDWEGSGHELGEAVRLAPDDPFAWLNLALFQARSGDDRAALPGFRKAQRLDPDDARSRFELANTLRRLGQFDEAAREFAHAVRLAPGRSASRMGEALCLIRLHRWSDAHERLELALLALPEDIEVLHALIRLLAAAPDDEVRDGARALELAPTLGSAAATVDRIPAMAMVAAENGLWLEAVQIQDRAIEAHRAADRTDALPWLMALRRRYEQQLPCREPWRDDDAALSPPPLTPEQFLGGASGP